MPDEPGWLGRAQWMPFLLPERPPGTRLVLALLMLYSALALVAGVVVGHVTGSAGWGFLAAALLATVGGGILSLVMGRFHQRWIATHAPAVDREGKRAP